MFKSSRVFARVLPCAALAALAAGLVLRPAPVGAGNNNNNQVVAVAGVSIDAQGVLRNATAEEHGRLRKMREQVLAQVPGELNEPTELRKISLRRLEAAIEDHRRKIAPISDEMKYLAGLQRIQYVFVYPEQNDIVLAGPGEGWKVDERGNVIGVTTGRPVLLLDDLLVALRTAEAAANGGLTCSIDPTAAGIQNLQNFLRQQRTIGSNPRATIAAIEQALGPQTISLNGVPPTSHFARVMVAADYRMKRLAMGFDPAPVSDMPNYLQMASASQGQNMLPRWWLAPNYEALLRDPEGLAWELRGQGVKAMTEEDFITATGNIAHSGKASPMAQKWADTMTAKYEELSVQEPVFGDLRNIMDMAVISALIVKENLTEKAGYQMALLRDPAQLSIDEFAIPREVPSIASHLKKGRNWIISASGGIEISSWQVAEKIEPSAALAPLHGQAMAADETRWWWN